MSFDELPQVDRFSSNEDESNTAFLYQFSQRRGFVVSKPIDKGCDFLLELINDGGSTNWRFPVQVKSIEKMVVVENGQFISYAFKVSRLRYMLNPIPRIALIVIYDVAKQKLYYDYAEKIYERLLEKRSGNGTWKDGEDVNIHIPIANLVNEQSVAAIHHEALNKHLNSADISPILYPKVVSSIANDGSSNNVEVENGGSPADILKSIGLKMFFANNIGQLEQLLDQTPVKLLREDAHLSLLAGITYWSIGMALDASFFLGKALNNDALSDDDRQHAEWTYSFVEVYMGKISWAEYSEKIKAIAQQHVSATGKIDVQYEIIIARNNIDQFAWNIVEVTKLLAQYNAFNDKIEMLRRTEDDRIYLHLLNIDNLGALMLKTDIFYRRQYLQDKKRGEPMSAGNVDQFEILITRMQNNITAAFEVLIPFAHDSAHSVTLADCYHTSASLHLHQHCNALRFPLMPFDLYVASHQEGLLNDYILFKEAIDIFMAHGFQRRAHVAAIDLLNLFELAKHCAIPLNGDMAAIRQQVESLSHKMGAGELRLMIPAAIEVYRQTYPL